LAELQLAEPYAHWTAEPIAGDASSRRYFRLRAPDGATAIVMDSRSEPTAPRKAFCEIAKHLTGIGLAAPQIYWADADLGLMVIEDLGLFQMAQWLSSRPADTLLLYATAVDVIVRLQSDPPPAGLVALMPTRAAGMIAPLFEWYARAIDPAVAAGITGRLQDALSDHAPVADKLSLRDFHAENLIWRPDRTGLDRIGLLDFQDAVIAPAEYDLVSLLRDARRDVPTEVHTAMTDRFARLTGRNPARVAAAAAVLGVQRNLRILGIFARLAQRDGKQRYLDLMPRVWRHIRSDLDHPALTDLRDLIVNSIPAPTGASGA
jgi:aminoglycoside/choline kinase family phosphotransferase